jgi:hypothetical protein
MGLTAIKPLAITLKGEENWYDWIELVHTTSNTARIWDYINPANEKAPQLLEALKEPIYTDVHPATQGQTVTFADLSINEAQEFNLIRKDFREKEQALLDIRALIQASVEPALFTYTRNCPTAREMLLNLKAEFCASIAVRERQLQTLYNKLKTIQPNESIENWAKKWEDIYAKCKELNLPDIQGVRPLFDITNAIKSRMPGFYHVWYFNIREESKLPKPTTTVRELLSNLKDYLRDNENQTPQKGRHTAFASFQNQGNQSDQGDQSNQPPLPCVCGINHWYSECYYLNQAIRPPGWTPKQAVERTIQAKIDSNPRTKAKVEKAQKKFQNRSNQPNQETSNLVTALLATAYHATEQPNPPPKEAWELYNSFILDSGATTHICHTRSRFRNFTPASELLVTAGLPSTIEGYGDVDIQVLGQNNKTRKVTLLNTAYIPDCPTNMVSCHKIFQSGIIWDQANSRLTQNGTFWAKIQLINNLYVVEYNPTTPQEAALLSQRFTPKPGQFNKSTEPKPAERVTLQTIHQRFAHPGLATTKRIADSTTGLEVIQPTAQEEEQIKTCEVCHLAKGHKLINRTPVPTPTQPYEVVSCDLLEFKKVNNDAGYGKWVLHFHCRYTGMNHVYILPSKNEEVLYNTIKEFCAYTQRRWNQPVRILHTDGESGFGSTIEHWLASQGITLHRSPPYTPDQNGDAERSGGVIIMVARAIMIESRIPGYMWPESVSAAGYLLNRTPRQQYKWITPIERLQAYIGVPDPQPKVGHIRTYGCRAYPLIQNQPKLNKLEPRTSIGYLVGWDSNNIFRIWIPTLQKVIRTRDVTFDENLRYDPTQYENPLPLEAIQAIEAIEILSLSTNEDVTVDQILSDSNTLILQPLALNRAIQQHSKSKTDQSRANTSVENPENPTLITPENTPTPGSTPPPEPVYDSLPPAAEPPLGQASPNPSLSTPHAVSLVLPDTGPQVQINPETDIDPETDSEATITVNTQSTRAPYDTSQGVDPANIITQPRVRKPRKEAYLAALESTAERVGYHNAFLAGTHFNTKQRLHRSELPPAPVNWNKVELHLHSEGFKYAAQKEFQDLESRGTWELVDQSSANTRPLPLKWVFTYKYDTDGYLDRYKARICVRGDLQPTSDKDSYAATLAAKVFRSLMAIAARFDLEAVQMDAVNAFINGLLDEEVYTYLPDGFKIPGKLLHLKRALYGLRRSPLLWLQELTSALLELGFKPIPEAQCLFTNGRIIVFFYVDDMVILYHISHQSEFNQFKQSLLQRYEFKDLGELKWFLGIRVIRNRQDQRLWLCQDSYIEKIASSFNLLESPQFKTPLAIQELYASETQATPQEVHAYQSRIGSTTYATSITRPDAARASNKLAEFLLNPSPAHLKAANRLIKYLYDTRYLAVEYSADSATLTTLEPEFRCSTDAAFGDDIDTRKSTEGYLFKLFGGPIDWKSTRQKLVTKSSTEAELVALSHASTEIFWWRRFFTQIKLQLDTYEVECDNQQTIRLLTTPAIKLATKLKHIDIHHHWLRQEVQDQKLQLKWIPTNNMPADGLTKALPTQKHLQFIKQLGLIDIKHLVQA